jgi:hypothetical protein
MTDMIVREITSDASIVSPIPAKEIVEAQPTQRKKGDKWVRTRKCWCPTNAATDCRYHSTAEPGWLNCPYENKSDKSVGKWLWASTQLPLSEKDLSVGLEPSKVAEHLEE